MFEPTPEQEAGLAEWLETRSDRVRAVAKRFPPWELFRIKSTGQIVHVLAFGSDDDKPITLRVNVPKSLNNLYLCDEDYQVFGLEPDDLEPTV
jgi:hypothetical protein